MNTRTSIPVLTLSGGLCAISFWVLGYFAPDFMAQAPVGAEATITGVFSVIIGYVIPHREGE